MVHEMSNMTGLVDEKEYAKYSGKLLGDCGSEMRMGAFVRTSSLDGIFDPLSVFLEICCDLLGRYKVWQWMVVVLRHGYMAFVQPNQQSLGCWVDIEVFHRQPRWLELVKLIMARLKNRK